MQARRFLLATALLVLTAPYGVTAQPAARTPGLWHRLLMRGSVVKVDPASLILCVGKADGAQAGQTLNVYRNKEHPHGPRGAPLFRRVEVGTVRIDSVIDDHFARATKVSGDVRTNDIVELRRSPG